MKKDDFVDPAGEYMSRGFDEWKGDLIRNFYKDTEKDIIRVSRETPGMMGLDINTFTFVEQMSEAEQLMWMEIRSNGNVTLYPEYPVLNYFVDFGNPYQKVGLEVDGKHHEVKKEYDLERDTRLMKEGWKIFRIPAREVYSDLNFKFESYEGDFLAEPEMNEEAKRWFLHSANGVLRALEWQYFLSEGKKADLEDYYSRIWHYSVETLERHRLVDFKM